MALSKPSFRDSAEKDLRKIDRSQVPRLLQAIRKLEKSLHPSGAAKLAGSEHTYRLRVGNYRIIYQVGGGGQAVIEHIRHRREAYRDR